MQTRLGHPHVLVVALGSVRLISSDVHDIARADRNIRIVDRVARSDLWALGIERNGKRPARVLLLGLARMVDDGLVVVVGAVGEVHADDIETSLAQRVDLLSRVCLGSNGTDDGGPAVFFGWLVLSVELRQPFNSGSSRVEVVESIGHGGGCSAVCCLGVEGRGCEKKLVRKSPCRLYVYPLSGDQAMRGDGRHYSRKC
jgi:hypothetical protein